MAVGGPDVVAAVGGAAHDDGDVDQAAGHVADTGGVVDELIEGDGMERPEHQLHDRADAEHGGTDAHADESSLGNRRVHDTLVTPFRPEAFGHFVGAVVLGHFLAHEDDVFVAGKFFVEAFTERFAVGQDAGHLRDGDGGVVGRIGRNGINY